jgi:hypothetical protein
MSATQCFGQDALADISSCANNTNVHEVVFFDSADFSGT